MLKMVSKINQQTSLETNLNLDTVVEEKAHAEEIKNSSDEQSLGNISMENAAYLQGVEETNNDH